MTVLKDSFLNPCTAKWDDVSNRVVQSMRLPGAYPKTVSSVKHLETHISDVFLAGNFAYKVKKPIQTGFLDYRDLKMRRHYCEEEVRLDQRYAENLYIGVVPITLDDTGLIRVEGNGLHIDYAVKMHRFRDEALLSHRIDTGLVTTNEIRELAATIASFHAAAKHCDKERGLQTSSILFENMKQVLHSLEDGASGFEASSLVTIHRWSDRFFAEHLRDFDARSLAGFVRECHGDLHLQNIVQWKGKLVPFDGIEFNDDLRFVDMVNDAAFLVMDLAARGRRDLARIFISCYLERTGDYRSLIVLRWYLVYRALVRAMVAKMKADQHMGDSNIYVQATKDYRDHVDLALQFTARGTPSLYITHGLSGSGKTTASEIVVGHLGAIRLRSDVERKRHFGFTLNDEIDKKRKREIYSGSASIATYARLERLARGAIRNGFPVIIDAAFLNRSDRQRFRQLAESENVPFAILDCHADLATLRQRISRRMAKGNDASDADLDVLKLQLESQEPLSSQERESVIDIKSIDFSSENI